MSDLIASPGREHLADATGIYVRALRDGRWDSVDIAELDLASLRAFLRSRGGDNLWAEALVYSLLGHEDARVSA
jgi:hypothetical protein